MSPPPFSEDPPARIFRAFGLYRWIRVLAAILAVWGFAAPASAAPRVVVLDPGHGGRDGGACWGGVREKNVTLVIARRVEAILRSRGVRTAMTRRGDRYVSLQSRAAVANGYRNAMLVSIHCNADARRRGRGIETYYTGSAGYRLARNIHRRLDARTSCPNRGIKRRGFTVLASSRGAAALVECGFLSSPSERRLLVSASYQKRLAAAIADGVMASMR